MNNKTKKTAILSLVAAMTLSCGAAVATSVMPDFSWPNVVVAEEAPVSGEVKIGETEYATFADALAATKTMTGNVTLEIYKKVTFNTPLIGSYDSITFVGKTADAEIYLDVQGYTTATGKTVNFNNLKLSKSKGGFLGNAGFMNVAFGIYDVVSVNYTNCYFVNGACASSGKVTFEGCTFKRSHDKYGLWAYGDVDTTVNNCVFDDVRGIKMFAEGLKTTVNLTVTNTDFSKLKADTEANIKTKPAIVLTSGESITLAGNTYSDMGVLELDLGGVPNGTPVTSADPITCVNDNGACGVMADGKIYTTVAQAKEAATTGSVVTLLHNTTETVDLAGVTLDTNGYTAANVTNAENVKSVARIGYDYYATLKEAFVAAKAGDTITFMNDVTHEGKWDCRSYTGAQYMGATFSVPVTIDGNGHTLKIVGEITDGYNHMAVFRFNAPATVKNLAIDMSESVSVFQNRFSAISAKSDIMVEDCTFTGSTTYTSARAIICGEGAATDSLNVSVSDCNFNNWKYGVVDEMQGHDTANSVTITNSTFTNAGVNVSATESVTFNNNTVEGNWVKITSYTNKDNVKVAATGNTLTENGADNNFINASPENITTDDASLAPAVKMGDTFYMSMESMLNSMKSGDTYTLKGNVDLYGGVLEMPAGATLNGNDKVVDGTIAATGDLTFTGATTVTAFEAGYYNRTITIGAGASLKIVGSGRLSVGWGNTFNITGNIAEGTAKTVDASTLTPSLYVKEGISIVGTGTNFNVTNALIEFGNSSTSKNSSASGTFNLNLTNSIWKQVKKFMFSEPNPGYNPTFNFNLTDSVMTTTGHLVFAATNSNVVFDNSNVNVGKAQQLENRGTLTIKNGSVVHAANAGSSNAGMSGTTIIDGATYVGTGDFTGSIKYDNQVGTLIVKNNATVSLATLSQMNAYVYEDSLDTFTYTLNANGTAKVTTLNDYNFDLEATKTALKANESVDVTVSINRAYYSAEYTFKYDVSNFICAADIDGDGKIFVASLYKGAAGDLATYTLVARNDINNVTTGDMFEVSGNVLQYKEQALNGLENVVTGDKVNVTLSLNYTASVVKDYISGYSLVLVKGDDKGYAYNGVKMFYVKAYEAYALIVEGNVTTEAIDAALSKSSGCEVLSLSYNVNAEYVTDGVVDLKDATAVYTCLNDGYGIEEYMELYLRADVNGDGRVNVVDINEVVKNYTK